MRLRLDEAAIADLFEIFEYIAQNNPRAARSVWSRLRRTMDRLSNFPHSGHRSVVPGLMETRPSSLPYVIVYRISDQDDLVQILGIFHAARDRASDPRFH